MAIIEKMPYGVTAGGEPVELYRLTNEKGASADIITFGATIVSLNVPDKAGHMTDVVLGYSRLTDYEQGDKYLGAAIGRCANRISRSSFELNGKTYPLFPNNGENHLHGGKVGFDKKIWTASVQDGAVAFSYRSVDMEEGYPGTLDVTILYSLTEENELTICYRALCDADTVCNLTNHSYFNLAGQASGDVLGQYIQVFSDYYLATDEGSIPTGVLSSVAGTPLDLRKPVRIGEHINDAFAQLEYAGGYDHCWALQDGDGLHPMAYAYDEGTGITLTAATTLPGVQFYTGNYLDGVIPGKDGATNACRTAFCLESQYFPDAVHQPSFAFPLLKKGEPFHSETTYKFGIR